MSTTKNFLGAVFLVVAVLVAGCGGSGSGDSKVTSSDGSTDETVTPPTVTPPVCDGTIAKCIDASNIRVAKYKDDKHAAASYTFDDGRATSVTIAQIIEEFGFKATFFIVPGRIHTEDKWLIWKTLSLKGHEISNHSMSHLDLSDTSLPDATIDYEINAAQRVIEKNIGIRPLTFASPFSRINDRVSAMANQNHIATRMPPGNHPTQYQSRVLSLKSSSAIDYVNSDLSYTVNKGGWFIAIGHSIDDGDVDSVTSQFLRDHLSFLQGISANVWVDTFFNIARYRICSAKATPVWTVKSASGASIQLNLSESDSLCMAPLTVAVPIKGKLDGEVTVQTAEGALVPVTRTENLILFDVKPGEEAYLQIIDAAN